MGFEEEPFAINPYLGDRRDDFFLDQPDPSRSKRSQIAKRPTEDSLYDDRRPRRQGTGDFEPRKRLRYKIPLRPKSNRSRDEETGYLEEKPYGPGYSTQFGPDREASRGSLPPTFWEIISTKWIPDDEGREVVTLTVKDRGGKQNQEQVGCEGRWKHIPGDTMTWKQFNREVMKTPGLGPDDMALVARLLNKVQKTSEKKFVHGRFLKPITLVYEGEDPDVSTSYRPDETLVRKTATFVSLPVFTTCCPTRHTSTKESENHPVRALLQSRFHLRSTKKRDKEQVITKTTSIQDHLLHKDHVVHVPQIWALIINNDTVITYAALDESVLRGDTIKLISYTAAQLDEATWSVHFTDARGKDFYLPLRFCKTWFDLVREITDNCLHDEYSFIRDQLLEGGPVHKLVLASNNSAVNAERWSKLVEETKTEVIHLKLVDNESVYNRSLFTYYDDEGNEITMDPDDSADNSSNFSSEDGERSDASESSMSSDMSSSNISRAIDRLRKLRAKLRGAEDKGDYKKAEDLEKCEIPALEENLLEMTAVDLHLDAPTGDRASKMPRIIIARPQDHRLRSDRDIDVDSPLSPTERYRPMPRSRSQSRTRSRLAKKGAAFSGSAYKLSSEEPSARGHATQPWIIHDRNHSSSPIRHYRDVNHDVVPRGRSHIHSHMPNAHSLSRISTLPTSSRSGWDLLRSRVRDRQLPGLRSSPIFPMTDSNDIYYRPSEKQLARSYWDLVRSSVLDGGIHKLRNTETVKEDNKITNPGKDRPAAIIEKQEKGPSSSNRFSDVDDGSPNGSSPTALNPPDSSGPPKALRVPANKGENGLTKPPRVSFLKDSLKSKPNLKTLVKRAHEESTVPPKMATSPAALERASPAPADPTTDLPIFLWPTKHQQCKSGHPAQNLPELSNTSGAPTFKRFLQKPSEEIRALIQTSNTELNLHAVMAEAHVALKKPKKAKPEYAVLYEKTTQKTYADVASSMNAIRNAGTSVNDWTAAEERNNNKLVSQSRRASLASIGVTLRRKDSNRSLAKTLDQDGLGTVKLEIFEMASKILLAFVPKGYDAPDESVLRYVRSRLSEIRNLIQSIQMGVRAEDRSKQQRYQIPLILPAAFQHLVLLLVVISSISNWSEYSWIQMRSTFDDCEDLFVEGRKQLLLMIHTDDYRGSSDFQAVDSEALLSLIVANVISSMSTEGDFHLTEVYAEYTNRIQDVVRDSASVKVYDDIKLLREELDIIKNTLEQQDQTLREFRSTITITYGATSLSLSILDRILESISQRIDDFDELQVQAETARFLAAQSISLKAESNSAAIIVFTVVTIVFLPLSFVTSYLGMNTSDLRNMQSGQTLFWAIGVPVAFVVLSTALVAAFYGTLTQRVLGRAWRGKEKGE